MLPAVYPSVLTDTNRDHLDGILRKIHGDYRIFEVADGAVSERQDNEELVCSEYGEILENNETGNNQLNENQSDNKGFAPKEPISMTGRAADYVQSTDEVVEYMVAESEESK